MIIKLMDNLTNNIYQTILAGGNVLLVGPTDSGKTRYIKNTLIPFLQEKKMKVIYFSDPDSIRELNNEADVSIVDEAETLLDHDFLAANSNDSDPYYSNEYLAKVKVWHDKLGKLSTPSIFVLTRNKQEEIKNVVEKLKVMDWGAKVKCLIFDRS